MLRHAGPSHRLCGDAGAACHRRHPSVGPIAVATADEPAGQGRLERGHRAAIRHSPSASSIHPKKQRLTRSSGIPRAAARISSAGPPRAKSRSRSSKSIAPAANSANPGPPSPTSPAGWTRTGARELETAGRHRQQIRPGDAASPCRQRRRRAALPRLHQTARRSQSADLRLVVPGRDPAGPARRDRLHAEPADPAHGRK